MVVSRYSMKKVAATMNGNAPAVIGWRLLDQYPFDPAVVGFPHIRGQPVGPQQVLGDLHHDVVGVEVGVVVVSLETLKARGTGRKELHLASVSAAPQLMDADTHFLLLAEAHLG